METNQETSKWSDPLLWIVMILALSVLVFAFRGFFPTRVKYQALPGISPVPGITPAADSLSSILLKNRISFLEKSFDQTRADIIKICNDTVATSRDVVGLMALLIGLVSIAGVYKIKSVENMLRAEFDRHVRESKNEFAKEVSDGIEMINQLRQDFDNLQSLWSGDPSKIRPATDYFHGRYKSYLKNPYVIAALQNAANTIQDHSIKARLLRILVMLEENSALDNLIRSYQSTGDSDKNAYRLACRGLVKDGFQAVEERLQNENLLDEIMHN